MADRLGDQVHDSIRIAASVVTGIAPAACSTLTRNPAPESASLDDVRAAPGLIRTQGNVVSKDTEALGHERNAQQRAAGLNPSGVMSYLFGSCI
jgi:hypothetical protein